MPEIKVTIRDKVAIANGVVYVCGNSDYTMAFDFDPEWEAYETKTARFVYGEKYTDVVFSGNTCQVPVLTNLYGFKVGVFAGDLHTTTPAKVAAKKSILCGEGAPADPPADVYNQIMEKLNSGGSGGGGADWNAAEGEPGHVLHRTHYKKLEVLVPETIVEPEEDGFGTFTPVFEIVPGRKYKVTVDGVETEYTATSVDGMPVIMSEDGDFHIMSGALVLDDDTVMSVVGLTTTYTLSVVGEVYVPIPREYLPGSAKTKIVMLTDEDVYSQNVLMVKSCTCDDFIDDLYDGGKVLLGKYVDNGMIVGHAFFDVVLWSLQVMGGVGALILYVYDPIGHLTEEGGLDVRVVMQCTKIPQKYYELMGNAPTA